MKPDQLRKSVDRLREQMKELEQSTWEGEVVVNSLIDMQDIIMFAIMYCALEPLCGYQYAYG